MEMVHQQTASFMASVEECISGRESRKFEEGLNTKVKLGMYKRFGKSVEFKKYLHGICDAGSRLLFKFRSGTHGLNEELGRHRGREGKTECSLCGNECENVSHVLWECSAYSSTRASFMKKLQESLEDDYEDFESLENVEKSSYVLGSELWESKFDGLLALVKEYIVDVWEIQKLNYMIVTHDQDLVYNSVFSLHLGRGVVSSIGMVSLVRMVSLTRMVSLARMVYLVRKVKCI